MAIPGPKGTFECVDESCVDELRVADGSFVDLIHPSGTSSFVSQLNHLVGASPHALALPLKQFFVMPGASVFMEVLSTNDIVGPVESYYRLFCLV